MIQSVQKSASVIVSASISGIDLTISYSYSNGAPAQVNVNGFYQNGDSSYTLNRQYLPDGTFSPSQAQVFAPFDATFNAALANLVSKIFASYDTPENIETASTTTKEAI